MLFGFARLAPAGLKPVEDHIAVIDSAEDDIFPVEVRLGSEQNHELAPEGVFSGVNHREVPETGLVAVEFLFLEICAVDGLATGAVAGGEIAALSSEARYYSVKLGPLEVERLARLANAFFTCAESPEVLSGYGSLVSEELNEDPTLLGANLYDEEYPRVRLIMWFLLDFLRSLLF